MDRLTRTKNLNTLELPVAEKTASQPVSNLRKYQRVFESSPRPSEKTSLFYKPLPENPSPLAVLDLNHFNITASPTLIEQVKYFYVNIVGLKVGPRARLDHDGYWLYAEKSPILHLSARADLKSNEICKGYFNHISLSCTGLLSAIAKMQATKTPYRVTTVADTGQTQLFLQDPAGIGVELTFFDEFVVPKDSIL